MSRGAVRRGWAGWDMEAQEGCRGTGSDELGGNEMTRREGMRWDAMGCDGMSWDELG